MNWRFAVLLLAAGSGICGCSDSDRPYGSIHDAAGSGDIRAIRAHLRRGGDIDARDERQRTPLHAAAFWGRLRAVNVLLSEGADLRARMDLGFQPLHIAAYRGHVDVVAALIDQGADVEAVIEGGITGLHLAAADGCEGVARCRRERPNDWRRDPPALSSAEGAQERGSGAAGTRRRSCPTIDQQRLHSSPLSSWQRTRGCRPASS